MADWKQIMHHRKKEAEVASLRSENFILWEALKEATAYASIVGGEIYIPTALDRLYKSPEPLSQEDRAIWAVVTFMNTPRHTWQEWRTFARYMNDHYGWEEDRVLSLARGKGRR